jgi:hypothetical protein
VVTLPAPGDAALRVSATTKLSYNDYTGSCAVATAPLDGADNVYTFTASSNLLVTAKLTPTSANYKAALYIRSTCDTAGVADKCNFSSNAGPAYPVTVNAVVTPGTWFLVVDGVLATVGDYTLEISTASYTGVGATVTQVATYTSAPTIWGMAADASDLVYSLGGSSIGAVSEAGGTPYSKGATDGIDSTVLGYDVAEANGSIFSLSTGYTNTVGRLWKIKDATGWLNPPMRWDVPQGVTTSSWPTVSLFTIAFDGVDLICAMSGTKASAPVSFYAVSATAPELPRALGTVPNGAYYVRGLAADQNYVYVAGVAPSTPAVTSVLRYDRQNLSAAPVRLLDMTGTQTIHSAVWLDSLTAPKYLYSRVAGQGPGINVVLKPASIAPTYMGALSLPGVGTPADLAMTFDRSGGALYYFEKATNANGVIWKVQ